MASLITVDYLKSLPLGVPASVWPKLTNEVLDEQIANASGLVEQHCRVKFSDTTVTDVKRGNGTIKFFTRFYPILSVDSITWEDDLYLSGTYDPAWYRVRPDVGIIELKQQGLIWPFVKERTYTVQYHAGYSEVPGPVKQATAIWTILLLDPLLAPGDRGKKAELITNGEERIVELLEDYRREGGFR